mmetsp:Transcript_14710/g.36750  ORF Transcript_14710/g.36750 Transcript_14710/m.36750 type:complete len:102 (+) Transcript_14710:1640-1945(+)
MFPVIRTCRHDLKALRIRCSDSSLLHCKLSFNSMLTHPIRYERERHAHKLVEQTRTVRYEERSSTPMQVARQFQNDYRLPKPYLPVIPFTFAQLSSHLDAE